MTDTVTRLAPYRPRRETVLGGALLVTVELFLVYVYAVVSDPTLLDWTGVRIIVYPLVWINVSLWAVLRTRPAPAGRRHRRLAAGLAVGYFVVLAYAGGLVGPGGPYATGLSLKLFPLPPGISPAVIYSGEHVALRFIPYKVLGYGALAYLVYATVIDAAGSAVTGVLGLLSCVSCSWPVLASLVSGALGSSTAVAGAVYAQSYGLSTVVFVLTVGLLYWRPFGR